MNSIPRICPYCKKTIYIVIEDLELVIKKYDNRKYKE